MFQQKYLAEIKANTTLYRNTTSDVSVSIPSTSGVIYDVALVHRLTGAENGGGHHIYVDVLNRFGEPYRGINVRFTNANKAVDVVTLDKPLTEPGGNKPVFPGDTYSVEVAGDKVSAVVSNLHVRYENADEGNTRFHWSHYIVFIERVHSAVPQQPVDPPIGGTEIPQEIWDSVKLQINELFRQNLLLSKQLKELTDLVNKY